MGINFKFWTQPSSLTPDVAFLNVHIFKMHWSVYILFEPLYRSYSSTSLSLNASLYCWSNFVKYHSLNILFFLFIRIVHEIMDGLKRNFVNRSVVGKGQICKNLMTNRIWIWMLWCPIRFLIILIIWFFTLQILCNTIALYILCYILSSPQSFILKPQPWDCILSLWYHI